MTTRLACAYLGFLISTGCSTPSVECEPLVADGSRCVCPEGTIQVDEWACELPDGGVIRRPGDGGLDAGRDAGLDSSADSGVESSSDAGASDAGTDTSTGPDVALVCALPPRVTVGHPEVVSVSYTLENLGELDAGAVVLSMEFFDEVSSEWTMVHESSVVARVRADETRMGAANVVLPNFVVSGTNRYRCRATTPDDTNDANDTVDGEFVIDVTPDLALRTLGLPTGTFTSDTIVVFTVANVGAVATLGGALDLEGGNETFGGGWMTYRGNPDEGRASARFGALRAGETTVESTQGWCFYRLDDLTVTGRALDESGADLVVEDNIRTVPRLVSFRPGPDCFPE